MNARERELRLQIMLQPEELQAIENWRFNNRMPSRASAIRELLRRGLAAEGFSLAEAGRQSSSFSVIDTEERSASDRPSNKGRQRSVRKDSR